MLLADELNTWAVPPLGRERIKWRVAVNELLNEGIGADLIRAGMRACADKGYGPSMVANFVFGEANRATPQSRADRNVAAIAARQRPGDGPGLRELAAADAADRAGLSSGRPMTVIESR